MTPPLRVVLVGAGTRARKLYLPWLADRPAGEHPAPVAVAVIDTDPEAAAAAAHVARCAPASPSQLPALLADHAADLVVVSTPDAVHRVYVEQALDAGCACLVEKPLATTVHDAEALADLSARSRGPLLVAHNLRFTNLHNQVRRLLADGCIGTVNTIEFHYRLSTSHALSYHTRWHRRRTASGGLEITKSTHHIDLLTWWLGAHPVTVTASLERRHYRPGDHGVPEDADIHDTIRATIDYDNGTEVDYRLTCNDPDEGYACVITGSGGTCTVTYRARSGSHEVDLRSTAHELPGARVVPREPGSHAGADARMLAALPAALTSTCTDFARPADAAQAVAVGATIHASHTAGRPLDVPRTTPRGGTR